MLFLKVNPFNHPCIGGAGSYHFMSLTGNPVGVAKDFQLHVRLQETTANADGGKKKKSETAHVQKRADFPLRLGKNNASLYIYRCSYSNKLCLQQPDGRRQQNRKKKAKVVSDFFHNLVHFIARLSFFSESLIRQSPNPVAWKFPRSVCEDLACIDAHLIGEYRPQCMGFE